MRAAIFGLVYTEVVGQTDDDWQCASGYRTGNSRKTRNLPELALLGNGHLLGRGSYRCFGGGAGAVVERARVIAPDWHVARRTHTDQRGPAHRGSSNSAAPAAGNRELHHG